MKSTSIELRARITRQRRSLTSAEVRVAGAAIFARFLDRLAPALRRLPSARVAIYRPLRGEVPTDGLRRWLLDHHALPVYPTSTRGSTTTIWRMDPDRAGGGWERGAYGFESPGPDCPVVDPTSLDAVLVPGVAFGEAGERIGRGVGHYDRALPFASRALRFAFAFEFQLFPELVQEAWDQPVDWIFTEKRDISTARAQKWLRERIPAGA